MMISLGGHSDQKRHAAAVVAAVVAIYVPQLHSGLYYVTSK